VTSGSGGDLNIAIVVDISGSVGNYFSGAYAVGDVNGDGYSNTILDAEILGVEALVNSLIAEGLNSANLALISFDSSAQTDFTGKLDQDLNGNGRADIIDAAYALRDTGTTYFEGALADTINFFNSGAASGTGGNHVFFMSDGYPNSSTAWQDEAAVLYDPNGINADIRTFGVGSGASETSLDLLDDGIDNNSATIVLDPSTLDAALTSSGVDPATVLGVEIYVNGSLQVTVPSSSLVDTIFGLRFSEDISLQVGSADTVRAVALFDQDGDGVADYTLECSQIISESANEAPTISLVPVITVLDEGNDATTSTHVANIVINDDGNGTNTLALTGADAERFEIVSTASGYQLHLKAGEVLDFETMGGSLGAVNVTVDDPSLGSGVEDSASYSLGINDINEILETGTLTVGSNPQTIDLLNTYANPVVVGFVETRWGAAPVEVRVLSSTADTLEIFVQEPDYLDGIHSNERISYMVVEAGNWELADGTRIEAGLLDSNLLSSAGSETVDFEGGFFSDRPAVLSQVQSYNGTSWVTTRQSGIDASGFSLTMQEEEAGNSGTHLTETLGYIAIEQGRGAVGDFEFEAGTTGGVTHATKTVSLTPFSDGDAIQVVAQLSSLVGVDPIFARGAGTTASSFGVSGQEEQSLDTETTHYANETVDFFAFSSSTAINGTEINVSPKFLSDYDRDHQEGRTFVGVIEAEDRNGDPLTYALAGTGADDALFEINSATGLLQFRHAPDFEAPGDSNQDGRYEVSVSVSDGDLTTTTVIDISVTDRNEAPVITSPTAYEVAVGQTSFAFVEAYDPDGDTLTFFSLGTAPDDGLFEIDPVTGEIGFADSAYATAGTYRMSVIASDPDFLADVTYIDVEVIDPYGF
jgi:hypothetical protein